MNSLADLFTRDAVDETRPRAAVSTKRLETLFTAPRVQRPETARANPADDVPALQALVGGRGRAEVLGASVAPPKRIRRVGGRRDWVSGVVAVLAVLVLVVTLGVAWVVVSNRSPETDALRTLSQSEAVLGGEIRSVTSDIERLTAQRDAALEHAAAFEEPLAGLDGIAGKKTLAATIAARDQYVTDLEALTIPAPPAVYTRPQVDESSLASLGEAIDGVERRSDGVAARAVEVTAATERLTALTSTFTSAMSRFAERLPTPAATIAEENPDAAPELRDAVLHVADAIAADGLSTPESAQSLVTYADAVTALREDQLRVEEEIRRQQELEQQQQNNQPDPTEPPADPTDPPADPGEPEVPPIDG